MDTNLYVIDLLTDREVEPGDRVISFRGEPAMLVEPLAPRESGHSGYVVVLWLPLSTSLADSGPAERRYYDKVFNLAVHMRKVPARDTDTVELPVITDALIEQIENGWASVM